MIELIETMMPSSSIDISLALLIISICALVDILSPGVASWGCSRSQGLGCSPIKAVRELGSERPSDLKDRLRALYAQ